MFTQGRIRIIALAAADALCIAMSWSFSVIGYWAVGAYLRTHGWPGCPWGGYEIAEYLNFAPVLVAFICVNASLNLYHGNWMYPSAPLGPVEEFRRLLTFNWFSESTNSGMRCLFANAGIFTKVNVPKYLFLFSVNIQVLINFS